MHTTLRFFGDTSDSQRDALTALVAELAQGVSPWSVRATAVHGFPEPSKAHVLVLDVVDADPDAVPTLVGLAARAEAAAVALGFARELRPYHAHLTLARMRKEVDVSSFAAEAAELPPGLVTSITLYASRSGPSGAIYTPLARAALPPA
jgi:2'-5' RNA ligase